MAERERERRAEGVIYSSPDFCTGYYYVVSGGNNVYILRSKDLVTWELGHYNNGTVVEPSPTPLGDCHVIPPSWSAWNPPNSTVQLIEACAKWDSCVSDMDLTEIILAGKVATLVLYQPGNQMTTGVSNLLLHEGDLQSFLESYFN